MHGEAVAAEKPKGGEVEVEDLDPIERLRSDVMNVFRTDLTDSKADKDSVAVGRYVPSGRIQNDLVNYWLQ